MTLGAYLVNAQGVVTPIRPVEPFAIRIRIFDQRKVILIARLHSVRKARRKDPDILTNSHRKASNLLDR